MGDLEAGQLETIRHAISDDANLSKEFKNFLDSADDANLDLLFEEVDQSDYSLRDWIEALVAFYHWIQARNKGPAPYREMIGYTNCCTLMNAAGVSLPPLKVIVLQALSDYGFEHLSDS
tara:strand:- start:2447 stop:2803 length:357 start_codon:yes stop_codon:yes gene_type:complete